MALSVSETEPKMTAVTKDEAIAAKIDSRRSCDVCGDMSPYPTYSPATVSPRRALLCCGHRNTNRTAACQQAKHANTRTRILARMRFNAGCANGHTPS
jgi:hypothetical protein